MVILMLITLQTNKHKFKNKNKNIVWSICVYKKVWKGGKRGDVWIISGSRDKTIRMWSLRAKKNILQINNAHNSSINELVRYILYTYT